MKKYFVKQAKMAALILPATLFTSYANADSFNKLMDSVQQHLSTVNFSQPVAQIAGNNWINAKPMVKKGGGWGRKVKPSGKKGGSWGHETKLTDKDKENRSWFKRIFLWWLI